MSIDYTGTTDDVNSIGKSDELDVTSTIIRNGNIPKLTKYYGNTIKIDEIKDGDYIPVGGSILNDGYSIFEIADFKSPIITDFMDKINHSLLKNQDNREFIKKDLKTKTNFNGDLFYTLFVMGLVFGKYFNKNKNKNNSSLEIRSNILKGDNNCLSEVLKNNEGMCVEISLLAQKFFQDNNIKSSLFNGELLRNIDHEFGEQHTFLIISTEEGDFIFDPSNPFIYDNGIPFPKILKSNFLDEMKKGSNIYVECEDIYFGKKFYYGNSTGLNIRPEFDIIKEKVVSLI
ncbi:MAG: hypothetical protein Q9M94_03325 [Candidatus Gracilibacteria bacterium]|nr:hypothetical protein [Candidatus Gracilibacteria bacterium]MDQ7023075.1 hypothetical protein [Candidatus Gracilibacteria bacterium]